MQIDTNLADEAIRFADGSDIHDIVALAAMYLTLAREPGLDEAVTETERTLRAFVVRKRLERALLSRKTLG